MRVIQAIAEAGANDKSIRNEVFFDIEKNFFKGGLKILNSHNDEISVKTHATLKIVNTASKNPFKYFHSVFDVFIKFTPTFELEGVKTEVVDIIFEDKNDEDFLSDYILDEIVESVKEIMLSEYR